MASKAFVERLREQIGNEFAAHQQYVAIAAYYDGLTMPQMAGLFYRQAVEERGHAMMMVRYLLDQGESVEIPGLEPPTNEFADVVAPVTLALEQEKAVADQINALMGTARSENDFASDQFTSWFVKEQVEEIAKMNDLLHVVTRARDDINAIEDYVAREQPSDAADPLAPAQAGA